jgi:hypothetical protein
MRLRPRGVRSIMVAMPVAYSSPDLLPNVIAVYICKCGKQHGEYGRSAGELPPEWVQTGAGEYLCAHCAAALAARD